MLVYLPLSHARQRTLPEAFCEWPGGHKSHELTPSSACTDPAAQGAGNAEPAGHALPRGHLRHSEAEAASVAFEYVPTGHSCGKALPVGQKWPRGHGTGSTVAGVGQEKPALQKPAHVAEACPATLAAVAPRMPGEHGMG